MRNVWNLLARNRNYRLLLGANLVSAAGDWIMNIGMTFYVYMITGSVLASGAMFLVVILPQMLFGSLGGVYADRWNRQRTMIVTNLLLATTLIPLFVMDGRSQIWVLYAVVFAQGVLEQLFAPAEAATVPHVVPPEDLVAANALNGQNREVTRLLGAALGGLLAAVGGIGLVAVVDLVSYLVATTLVALMRIPAQPGKAEPTDAPRSLVRHEWVAGIRLCLRRRDLSTLLLFRVMNGFGEGVFSVLLAPFLIGVLHANGGEYGAISAVQGIGGVVGGIAVASLGRRFTPRQLLGFGAFLFGLFDLVIALYPLALPTLWPVFGLMVVVGLPGAALSAGFATLQQERTPDAYRGRIFGAINTGSAAAMILGTVLASALGGVFGVIAILSLQGIVHMVAGPLVLARLGTSATSEVQQQVRPAVLAGEGQ